MQAVIRTGDPKSLTIAKIPEPQASEFPNHYIIRTRATALTRGELAWPEPLQPEIPIPGYDFAGVVISAPEGAHRFNPGDEVYGLTSFSRQGNAREVTIATEEELCKKSKNRDWIEAASIPLSALSAYQALVEHGNLTLSTRSEVTGESTTMRRKRVLVTAASGGVGVWGVQLARQFDADVVATCGSSNIDFVKSLGADTVLDYSTTRAIDWVGQEKEERGFDIILDCIGGKSLEDAWRCARAGGKVVSVAEPPDPKKPEGGVTDGVTGTFFIVEPNKEQLGKITEMMENGGCRGVVDSVFGLEQWKSGFDRLESGHARGKVVLTLD
ncbi:hypothetical protein BCR34DRAFT_624535 [Clohesyomyces aquaticus]|uniref:Enoyl reductase (ER) domain-containing protein n=1 Tax=Clohesyomyces aquaticus TaxID=1231657 RepID=A0A1Y1ZQC4_9PLEO|nr:hypothetical protein BCR34DRAFT_624535 [Clohesyomyces aquaticus]